MKSTPIHNRSLDGLRFFAFLGVFLFHSVSEHPVLKEFSVVRSGGLGVLVFFVLSGFLIGRILIGLRDREGTSTGEALRIFYIRRALRIFPLYYAALFLLQVLPMPWPRPWEYLAANALYLSNALAYWIKDWPGGTAHFWTLSVEEHFYLLAPILVLMLRPRHLEMAIVALCAVAAAERGLQHRYFYNDGYLRFLSPFQFDCLAVGLAAALVQERGRFAGLGRVAIGRLGFAGVVVLTALVWNPWDFRGRAMVGAVVGQFLWSVASAVLVVGLWNGAWGPIGRVLSWSPLVYLGKISYGLYVIHFPIVALMSHATGEKILPLWAVAASFAATVALAMLSWHAFENPINECKRFFPYPGREPARAMPEGRVACAAGLAVGS